MRRQNRFWVFTATVAFIGGVFACVAAMPGQPVASDRPPLEARLLLDRAELRVGESLAVALLLKNASDRPVVFDGRMILYHNVEIVVRDAKGRNVPYPGRQGQHRIIYQVAPPEREAFVTLQPGYIWGCALRIREPGLRFRSPGVYRVSATFSCSERGSEFGLDAWTGRVSAKPVRAIATPTRRRH